MKGLLKFYYYGNLHVVLATGICATAFFKLPDGQTPVDLVSLVQLMLACWAIYILDRILDVIKTNGEPKTVRHQYHWDHQYNLQVLAIALIGIVGALLLFQSKDVVYYGIFLLTLTLVYLKIIVPKYPQLKDFFMPLIYTLAVVGVPFVANSSISLSSWIVAIMFFIVTFQNLLCLSYFEKKTTSKRKWVVYLFSVNLFVFIFFFWGNFYYVNLLALIFLFISLCYSAMVSLEKRFENYHRILIDTLLFLPLLLF